MPVHAAALVLALALAASPAAASDHLDGTYVLDPDASDDPGLMAEIVPMNAATLAVVRRMRTRLTIDADDDEVTLTIKTPIAKRSETYRTDGSARAFTDPRFGAGEVRVRWEDDGKVLVFESDTTSADDRKVHNVTRRFLEEPDTLIQQFEVTLDGGDPVVIRRVFRRQG